MQSILKIKTKSTFVHNNREPEIWFSFLTFYIKFVIIHLCIFLHVALIPYSLLNQGFNYIRFLVKTFLNEKGGNQTMQKAYKVISATSDGFFRKVRAFFIACAKRNELPSTRNVFNYLVPNGVPNTATPGSFGDGKIFKYEFMSSDGVLLMVKYHAPDVRARLKHPGCNSSMGWTCQIKVGHSEFLTVNLETCEVGKSTINYQNLAHIPVRYVPVKEEKSCDPWLSFLFY